MKSIIKKLSTSYILLIILAVSLNAAGRTPSFQFLRISMGGSAAAKGKT